MPIVSRIITIVEAYDAMTSELNYRGGQTDEIAIIRKSNWRRIEYAYFHHFIFFMFYYLYNNRYIYIFK